MESASRRKGARSLLAAFEPPEAEPLAAAFAPRPATTFAPLERAPSSPETAILLINDAPTDPRDGISTTCLYDSRGNSAASSWDKLPLFGAKKKVDLRRRRHAIAPITRRIHARHWLPVEQSGKLFGEPPTHAKKPRSRRGRDDGSSVCSAETLEVTGQGAATKLAPLQTALRPETR